MKKFLLSIATAIVALGATAQNNVTKPIHIVKDGAVVASYTTDDVDYIAFDDEELPQVKEADFAVTIESEATLAKFNVKPKDPTMKYMLNYMTYEKSLQYNTPEYGGTKGLYEFDKSWYEWLADMYYEPWQNIMSEFLVQGDCNYNTANDEMALAWNADHVLYIYGVDDNCELITDVYVYPFTTKPANRIEGRTIDVTNIELEPAGRWSCRGSFTFTPDSDDYTYYATILKAERFEKELQTTSLEDYVKKHISTLVDYPRIGEYTATSTSLTNDTPYYLMYFGYDDKNALSTDIKILQFRTPVYVPEEE